MLLWGCQEAEVAAPLRDGGGPGATGKAVPVTEVPGSETRLPLPLAAAADPDLKLMTFNIRYGTAPDGADAWPNRRAQLFDLIKNQAADVIGLQEALASQLTEILAAVPGYARLGVGRDDGKSAGEFSAILYRTARFRADTSGTFWLSDTPEVPGSKSWGNNITRICTWAHLTEISTGRGFYAFNAHLDHESQTSREKSVALIAKRMAAVQKPAEPAFLTGDFNVDETNPVVPFVEGKAQLNGAYTALPLKDTFREAHPNDTVVGTFHSFTGDTTGAKIDYIFVLPRLRALSSRILHDHVGTHWPSDHFPVIAGVAVPDWATTSIRRN